MIGRVSMFRRDVWNLKNGSEGFFCGCEMVCFFYVLIILLSRDICLVELFYLYGKFMVCKSIFFLD